MVGGQAGGSEAPPPSRPPTCRLLEHHLSLQGLCGAPEDPEPRVLAGGPRANLLWLPALLLALAPREPPLQG